MDIEQIDEAYGHGVYLIHEVQFHLTKGASVTTSFDPHLDMLSPSQRRLWEELANVPSMFVLYGGTAIALHLGHRTSVDFDFFGSQHFDPDQLYRDIPFLNESQVTQKAPDTLTCRVDRNGLVVVSFFGVPEVTQIKEPLVAQGNKLKVASLVDLAGTKASVVQKRAEAKDYLDLDAIIAHGEVDLPTALSAGCQIYGSMFNPEITLKALSYFEDGNLRTLPIEVQDRLAKAVKAVDLDHLPQVGRE